MPIDRTIVPYDGKDGAKLLLVGEAPGSDEVTQKLPFVGMSGDILIKCLGRAGVERHEVKLANLCKHRPLPSNRFEELLGSPELKSGVLELYDYIAQFRPNVIGALGAWPLKFLVGKEGITRWRGSILPYINDKTIKVIPALHPAAVLRDSSQYPIFDIDIRRMVSDSLFPEFNIPDRSYVLNPKGIDLEVWVEDLCKAERLAVDIETVKGSRHILCCGFAATPLLGVSISTEHEAGKDAVRRILAAPNKKIFHFGTFDTEMLYLNGYEVNNYWWDTMVAQHAMNPELPRALDFLTSIYTRQPYYKKEGRGNIPGDVKGWSVRENKEGLYRYNATDVIVTLEIQLEQEKELKDDPYAKDIFEWEMSEIPMASHISRSGMFVDEERRAQLEKALNNKFARQQFILDRLTGFETNVASPKLKTILYDKLKLPTRRNKEGKATTDEDSIVSLIQHCKGHLETLKSPDAIIDWKVKLAVCQLILEIRGIRKLRSSYIGKHPNDDGRIRGTFKICSTDTGRWACDMYVDGTGLNLQTIPRDPFEVPEELLEQPTAVIPDGGDEEESSPDQDTEYIPSSDE